LKSQTASLPRSLRGRGRARPGFSGQRPPSGREGKQTRHTRHTRAHARGRQTRHTRHTRAHESCLRLLSFSIGDLDPVDAVLPAGMSSWREGSVLEIPDRVSPSLSPRSGKSATGIFGAAPSVRKRRKQTRHTRHTRTRARGRQTRHATHTRARILPSFALFLSRQSRSRGRSPSRRYEFLTRGERS
jgi:hypothetical protein